MSVTEFTERAPHVIGTLVRMRGAMLPGPRQLEYRGVDRAPPVLWHDQLADLRRAGKGDLADLWERHEEETDGYDVYREVNDALELRHDLIVAGVDVDVIYSEVALIPDRLDQYPAGALWAEEFEDSIRKQDARIGTIARPPTLEWLGFDIAWPVPAFHSALYQPGLDEELPNYVDTLNHAGLAGDRKTAEHLMRAALSMDYGPLPFCVLAIWKVPA